MWNARPSFRRFLNLRGARHALAGLIAAIVGLTAIAVFPRGASTPPFETVLPVSHWQALFEGTVDDDRKYSLRRSRSKDSTDFYSLAYQIDAYASMFEATGEARYADFGLTLAENMIASARPSRSMSTSQFQDGYRGWVSRAYAVRGQEVALYESYAWRYVTRLLRVVHGSRLHADTAYRKRYERVLAFAETNIFQKWYSRGLEEFIYRERTHMAAHWAYISLNLAQLTTSDTARARYLEVVDNVDNSLPNHPSSLRGQLRPNRTDARAYWWSDVWGKTTGAGQDVSHGNGVISYIVESRDLDAGWKADEVSRFSRTLTSFVLGAEDDHPGYVDGSGRGNGWIADGFVKLGRYDRAVQAALERHDVQNSQYYAAMALNAKLLSTAEP